MAPRGLVVLISATLCVTLILGCSSSTVAPVFPEDQGKLTTDRDVTNSPARTQLWGLWDVHIDLEAGEAVAVANRSGMFTANVVTFLNSSVMGLKFVINDTPIGPDYVDVDIDVILTHPFPGMPEYHGYDVRGVFMGNGSGVMKYNPDLLYSVHDTDQSMFADTLDGYGGPDGYTRWFNFTEFSGGGMPLFGYTQGNAASPGFAGTATFCPFRYFADGLGTNEDLWTWLVDHADQNGVFSSGATNERNYYLRFPTPDPNVRYGYAVIANWEGDQPEHHPSNASEAIACDVIDNSDLYYVDDTNNGGNIIMDISLWDWDSTLSAGFMESYTIQLDATPLTNAYVASTGDMTPIGGGEHYSTYHFEIPADNLTSTLGNEIWVIAECADVDYSNEFGVMNDAWEDPLAAFFRYDLDVSPEAPGDCDVVVDPASSAMPYVGWAAYFTFDASGSGGGSNTYEWDFDNDGIFGDSFDSGTDETPVKYFDFTNQEQVCVRVTGPGGQSECCVDVDIIAYPSKNIPLRTGFKPWDLAIDPITGRILVIYDDVTVWQYLLSDWYQTPNPNDVYYDTEWELMDPWPGHTFHVDKGHLDIADNSYTNVNFAWNPSYWVDRAWIDVVDDSGSLIVRHSPSAEWPWSYSSFDALAWGSTGPYPNDLAQIWGNSVPGYRSYISKTPSSNYYSITYWRIYYSTGGQTGYDKLMAGWVRGTEVDQDDEHFWTVERPDYYASRWELGTPGYNNNGILYDNAHFGIGSQTDSDNGFNMPRDMTRDDQNQMMVLDELSDETCRIKAYDVSAMPVTSLGGMDLDDLTGPSYRMDSSDFADPTYGCYVLILHGDDTDGYFMSVYMPDELPW